MFHVLDFDWSYSEYDYDGITCALCNSYEEEVLMALNTNKKILRHGECRTPEDVTVAYAYTY